MAKKKLTETLPPARSITNSFPENHGKLGRRMEIGSTAHVSINRPGMKHEWFVPTVEVLIGIGKDHVAYLIMDTDAWQAFKKNQKINIDSLKTFTSKFL
jgi:hypothetical protein